jgi:hypothetical protein
MGWPIRGSKPSTGKRFFSSRKSRPTLWSSHPPTRWPGREVHHSPPFSTKFKNEWNHTSTSPFMPLGHSVSWWIIFVLVKRYEYESQYIHRPQVVRAEIYILWNYTVNITFIMAIPSNGIMLAFNQVDFTVTWHLGYNLHCDTSSAARQPQTAVY